MKPFPFEWVDFSTTEVEYLSVLTRVLREYDRRFHRTATRRPKAALMAIARTAATKSENDRDQLRCKTLGPPNSCFSFLPLTSVLSSLIPALRNGTLLFLRRIGWLGKLR